MRGLGSATRRRVVPLSANSLGGVAHSLMFPSFELGPWHLQTYTVTYVVAITVAGMLSFHRLLQLDQPVDRIMRGILLTIVSGFAGRFLGERLIGLLQQTARPYVTAHWGGSNIFGVVIGGSIVAVLYIRHYGVPLGRPFDLGGLPVPLGQAIGRIGCFAAGCCYGKVTDSWLGLTLRNNRGEWAVRYPTQLMSAATDLLIFVGLVAVERYGKRQLNRRGDGARRSNRGWPFDGFIFLLYADLYCLKRFGVEFLRGDVLPPLMGPFNLVQIVCLAVFLIATVVIAWNLVRTAVPAATVPVSSVGE